MLGSRAELHGLQAPCWLSHRQVQIPLRAPLPSGTPDKPFQTSTLNPKAACGPNEEERGAGSRLRCLFSSGLSHSPVGSTKGNQTLQRYKDKHSRRPSNRVMWPSFCSSSWSTDLPLSFSYSHLLQKIQMQSNPFLP